MFAHMVVGSDDLDRSKRFYDATFAALGAGEGVIDARGRLVYTHKERRFVVTRPLDGQASTPGNGMTIGLLMDGPNQAVAWHTAGIASGGTAIEDAPGIRHAPFGDVFLAYLRDPDGNKLCATYRYPKD